MTETPTMSEDDSMTMTELQAHQKRTCEKCKRECELEEPEHPDEVWNKYRGDDVERPCDNRDCDGGRVECDTCDGTGELEDPDEEGGATISDCGDCDGDGKVDCPEGCDEGWFKESCSRCFEEFDHNDTVWAGDGEFVCHDCMGKAGAFRCPDCDGKGELPLPTIYAWPRKAAVAEDWTVSLDEDDSLLRVKKDDGRYVAVPRPGRKAMATSAASCSMCGCSPARVGDSYRHLPSSTGGRRDDPDEEAWVVRASMLDTDGVYFSYLCYLAVGEGCLVDVLEQQEEVKTSTFSAEKQEKLDAVADLFGEPGSADADEDGLWSTMVD